MQTATQLTQRPVRPFEEQDKENKNRCFYSIGSIVYRFLTRPFVICIYLFTFERFVSNGHTFYTTAQERKSGSLGFFFTDYKIMNGYSSRVYFVVH